MAITSANDAARRSPESGDTAAMTHRQIMEALSGLLLGMFVAIISSTIVTNALPKIIGTLGGGQSAYTWVVTASLLAMTATTPLWGKLADLFSKKALVQIALLIYVAGSVVAGLSQNPGMLIACRAVQGIGAGGLSALAQIVMAAMISPRERGRYSGYLGAVFAVATVGGPLLGGVITDTSWLGWRWCFYVGVPFAVVALIVLQRTLRLPVTRREVKVDWLGAFLVTAAVCLLLVWVTFAGDKYAWASWQTLVMVLGAVVLAVLFVFAELRAAEPIVPMHLFANRTISLASAASLFIGVAMFAGTVFFSQYFQLARGESPTMSGIMTIPMIGGLFISSTVSGQIITRTGRWKAWLVTGGFLVTAGLGLLGTIRYDTDYWLVAIYMAMMGLGIGMTMQNLVLCTQNQVAPHELGAASSLVTFFRSLGGAIGVSALGAVMAERVKDYISDGLSHLNPAAARAMGGGSQIPDISALPGPVRTVVEDGYGHGIADVFLIAAPIALVAFLLTLFIKEVALRTTGALAQAAESESGPEPVLSAQVMAEDASGLVPEEFVSTGITVHGRVRAGDGTPVTRTALTLISPTGRQIGRAIARGDGHYALDAPEPGSYVLIASADGFQPQATPITVGARPLEHDVRLSGMSGLAGTVRAADDGAPVADALVIVTDSRGDVLAAGASGPEGDYALTELVPGPVTVAVNAATFQPVALPAEVGSQGITQLDVVLSRGAQLRGVVYGAHGPLGDARVSLVDAAGAVIDSTTTDADGRYLFANLAVGDYTVVASGYPETTSTLTLAAGSGDHHVIELAHPRD
ncbi:MFS transporter [Nocardia africana]|uniref:Multidrug-efflux transporter 3 n=1 Tax=Nocardia africana TaxID=134964 RepID=A0A378WPP3_9NOCA|nr:MFS transporter [Nocardia africana]MCC3314473.1 MFS transporter [Nocardia africana]SUA43256.1 Multidrug-efflux transporter 3 [Nocardia africana]